MSKIAKNFYRSEFACKCGCGFDTVDIRLIQVLQDIRWHLGPVLIISGCRCPKHNATIPGAAENSQHVYGRAADIVVMGVHEDKVVEFLERYYPKCSIGRYKGRTHVDTRTNGPARWDMR